MKRTALVLLLAALPASAQSFADDTPFGGSDVFSMGLNPRANPARFDQVLEGLYLGVDAGDLKPRGAHDAATAMITAEADPSQLPSALMKVQSHPWSQRTRSYGLAWAWTGGVRFGYTHEDLRGTYATPDISVGNVTFDARQAVVDRIYVGAGSKAGSSALGFTLRLERVRFGQESLALTPTPGQSPLGDPELPLNGFNTPQGVTSATLDAGYLLDITDHLHFGLTLDRIAGRSFGDLRENPQGRAGLQMDLSSSWKLSFESDLNGAERLPVPVKRRIQAASLHILLSPAASLSLGAERRRFEGAPQSTVVGAALHLTSNPWVFSFGFRFGDDRPLAAAAIRLPGGL